MCSVCRRSRRRSRSCLSGNVCPTELERVLRLDLANAMLGINNRNLGDFTVDLGNTRAIMSSSAGQEARAA